MNKVLVFDMDGTIADFYGVDGWLDSIHAEDPHPYKVARPLYDKDTLNVVLMELKAKGWRIVVTSWLANGSTPEYDYKVRAAKVEWLKNQDFPYDEIHLVKYGTNKAKCTRRHGGYQVLVDDNATVRKGWKLGNTIDANNNILASLMALN